MVRLVFRPFTQVWRTICTSVPLRAFTRVSPGFTLLKRSSPSFGSYQICSCSSPLSETQGRLLLKQLVLSFLMRSGFSTLTLAYWIDSLVRVSRRGGRSHFDRIARRPLRLSSGFHPTSSSANTRSSGGPIPGAETSFCLLRSKTTKRTVTLAADSLWSANPSAKPARTRLHRAANDYSSTTSFSTISSLLTLFSKFFSPFLRSTCSLSVSHKYLALEEVYLPFRAAIPNNPTLRKPSLAPRRGRLRGFHPLWRPVPRNLCRARSPPKTSLDYNSTTSCHGFSLWAFACSLAATGAILVSFFSSAYWYA